MQVSGGFTSRRRTAAARRRGRLRQRLVTVLALVAVVLTISTQSAPASELTAPAHVSFASVTRFWDSLFAKPGTLPVQERGTGKAPTSTRAGVGSGHAPGLGRGQLGLDEARRDSRAAGLSGNAHTGFNAATSKRLDAKATSRTTWFQNTDGSQTERISESPTNYQTADGSWHPIDPSLAQGTDGRWHQRANGFGLTLATGSHATAAQAQHAAAGRMALAADPGSASPSPSPSPGDTSSASGQLADLTFTAGESFGWSLAGASSVAGAQSGDTVTYAGILPDTTAQLTSQADGVKESLILSSAAAGNTWTFPLSMTGVSLSQGAGGTWNLVDGTGNTVAVIAAPFAFDASVDPQTGDAQTTHSASYTLSTVNGVEELTLTVDQAWLDDPARVFPVTVDPTVSTVSIAGQQQSTYVNAGFPDQNYLNYSSSESQVLRLGKDPSNPNYVNQAFLNFPAAQMTNTGYRISSETLSLFELAAQDPSSSKQFDVYDPVQAWTPSTITWNNKPTQYYDKLGTWSGAATSASCGSNSGRWDNVPLSAYLMSKMAAWPQSAYHGLWLTASSQADNTYWKKFNSSQVAACSPYLTVTWSTDIAPQLDTASPDDGTPVTTLTPELTASGHDPDTSPDQNVEYQFSVFPASGGKAIVTSPVSSTGSYVVPAGTLSWGKAYEWEVCVTDGWECQSSISSFSFTTAVPPPVLSQNLGQSTNGHGFDASLGNYMTSDTDAQIATVGPELAVKRSYNSLDGRFDGAFGAGWSSSLDMKATEVDDSAGNLIEVVVTYPDGSQVPFARNSDGTFASPAGRYATLNGGVVISSAPGSAVTDIHGYTLVDKDGVSYVFYKALDASTWGISWITDRLGRKLTYTYSTYGGVPRPTQATSSVSNRSLNFAWAQRNGATQLHVTQVTLGGAGGTTNEPTVLWTYNYGVGSSYGDQLTSVCPPMETDSTQPSTYCTKYTYQTGSIYQSAVLDGDPYAYWPMNEATGATTAVSAATANAGTDDGTYTNVQVGTTATHLAGSIARTPTFNGTTSSMSVPSALLSNRTYFSVALWFRANTGTTGVIFSKQNQPISSGTNPTAAQTNLYIGTDGKLYGGVYQGGNHPAVSVNRVNDGAWHFVVLSAAGGTQMMSLDGDNGSTKVAQSTGTGVISTGNYAGSLYLGAGFEDTTWPGQQTTAGWSHFTGNISDFSFYTRALTATDANRLYGVGTTATWKLTQVDRPRLATNSSEQSAAKIGYDSATGRVVSVTDGNGGVWGVSLPVATGSSKPYRAAVLAQQPQYYWTYGDGAGAPNPVDEVNPDAWTNHATIAQYNAVTLGTDATVFGDGTTAGTFDGSSSYVTVPTNALPSDVGSVSMWFKTTHADGILLGSSTDPIGQTTTTASYDPLLYVGTDGHLQSNFWRYSPVKMIASATAVNDGVWHHVVLASDSGSEVLYLDGKSIGSVSQASLAGLGQLYIGAGYTGAGWPDESNTGKSAAPSYFNGSISDVAFYQQKLSADQVSAQWLAAKNAGGYVQPVEQVTVTGPADSYDGKSTTEQYYYDPVHSARLVKHTDPLGNSTIYGYDTSGFLATVTDPNGDQTITGHDVRGNAVSTTTCQYQATKQCSTSYATYYPDDTTAQLTTNDPRNDKPLTQSDPRSSSAADSTYQTKTSYDANGNILKITDPLGRVTTANTYTDGTSANTNADNQTPNTCAGSNVVPPAGLVKTVTTATGAVTNYTYYANGDTCSVAVGNSTTDTDSLTTTFTYDNYGQVLQKVVHADTGDQSTNYVYDGQGRVTQTTGTIVTDVLTGIQHENVTTTVYDEDGNISSQAGSDKLHPTDPAHPAVPARIVYFNYNNFDQKASVTDPNHPDPNSPLATSYTYDAYGNVATKRDPLGRTLQYFYDADGRLRITQILATASDGTPASPNTTPQTLATYAYDSGGRLASQTDANNNVTSYLYYDNNLTYRVTRSFTHLVNGTPVTDSYKESESSYDAAGNLTDQKTNNLAADVTYAYDAAGRLTTQTEDPSVPTIDRVTNYFYDNGDRLHEKQTGQGSTIYSDVTDDYDALGRKLDEKIAAGPGGATNITGPALTTTWTNYNNIGLPQSVTTPGGHTTSYSYDTLGRIQQTTGATVNVTTIDGSGNVSTSAQHQLSQVGYDNYGEPLETEANGNETFNTYDLDGQKTSSTLPSYTAPGATTATNGTTNYTYDAAGEVTAILAPDSTQTSFTYTNLGQANQVTTTGPTTNPGTWTSNSTYNLLGQLTQTTSPNGVVTGATFDYLGRKSTTSIIERAPGSGTQPATPVTYTTNYAYSDDPTAAHTMTVTSPDGVSQSQTLDALGQVTTATSPASPTDPTGQVTSYTHDVLGNLTQTTRPDGTYTQTTYDNAMRPLTTASYDSSGTVRAQSSVSYNPDGTTASNTDANGNTTTYLYDAAGRLQSQTQPVDATHHITVGFGYDLDGHVTAYTSGNGNVNGADPTQHTTYTSYNAWGLPETTIQPPTASFTLLSDRRTTRSYDAAGRLSALLQPGQTSSTNITTSFGYDAIGDLTSQTATGAEADTPTVNLSYDLDGRVQSATTTSTSTAAATSESYKYNDRGELLSSTGSAGNSTFAYDGDALMTSRQDASGTTSYGYEPTTDRLKTVNDPLTGSQLTYTYTPNKLDYSINYGTSGDTRSIAFDPLGRLSADSLKTASGTKVKELDYGYDANGNLTSKTDAAGTTNTYCYDQSNRLTSWTNSATTCTAPTSSTVNYGYDADSNRTQVGSANFQYDNRDQLTADGTTTYAYTARGTLQSEITSTGSVFYKDDAYGHQATAGTTNYTYDAAGRLITQTNGTTSTTLQYSGTDNTISADGTGTTYSRTPGGALLAEGTTPGNGRLLWTDLHSDVVADFSPTATAVTDTKAYDPLGKVLTATGTVAGLSVGYQSEYTDQSNGQVNMAARWYNPANGQFTNKDTASNTPTPNSANANPFAYGNDNPLTGTDPSGHICEPVHGEKPDCFGGPPRYSPGVPGGDVTPGAASHTHGDGNPGSGSGSPITIQDPSKCTSYACMVALAQQMKQLEDSQKADVNDIERDCRSERCMDLRATPIAMLLADGGRYTDGSVIYTYDKLVTDLAKQRRDAAARQAAATKCSWDPSSWGNCVKNGVQAADEWINKHPLAKGLIVGAVQIAAAMGCANATLGVADCRTFSDAAHAKELIGGFVGEAEGTALGIAGMAGSVYKCVTGSLHECGQLAQAGLAMTDGQAMAQGLATEGLSLYQDISTGHISKAVGRLAFQGVLMLATEGAGRAVSALRGAIAGDAAAAEAGDLSDALSDSCLIKRSFDPATSVLLADGKTKPIGKLKVGDKVEAADPTTGKDVGGRSVQHIWINHDTDLLDVTINDGHGHQSVFHTTANHPFWDDTTHTWVRADHLGAGHHLASTKNRHPWVVATRVTPGAANRWNLTVQQLHTYYVVAGSIPVLVHNCQDHSDELLDLADDNIGKTNTVSEVLASDGKTIGRGISMARTAAQLTDRVREAALATGHHMGCSEIGALCELEQQDILDLGSSESETLKVMGGSQEYTAEEHLDHYPQCPSCQALWKYLKRNYG